MHVLAELQRHSSPVLFTSDEVFGAEGPTPIVTQPAHVRCLREARWKFVTYFDPGHAAEPGYELYDLENDPAEMSNCADPRSSPQAWSVAPAVFASTGPHLS